MIKIHTAASLAYYLSKALGVGEKASELDNPDRVLDGWRGSEEFGVVEPSGVVMVPGSDGGDIPYYAPEMRGDPLARTGRWIGKFAAELGLPEGSVVDARSFSYLYYGYKPDGSGKLKEDMPSIELQMQAQNRISSAERALVSAQARMKVVRRENKVKGKPIEALFASEAYHRAKAKLDRADADLAEARKHPGNRQPAHDIHLDAPKPVSILLFALMNEGRMKEAAAVEAAWVKACESVLKDVEAEFVKARPRDGDSRRRIESVKGAAIAMFTHFDARPTPGADPDPHLHVHGVLLSQVHAWDDEIRAAWTAHVNTCAPMLGTRVRALFAADLMEMGFSTTVDEAGKDMVSFGIAGISKSQSREFSRRHEQVKKNLEKGLSEAEAVMDGRQSKNKDMGGQGMIDSVGARLKVFGISSDKCKAASAEKIALEEVRIQMRLEVENGTSKGWGHEESLAWTQEEAKRVQGKLENIAKSRKLDSPEAIIDKLSELEPTFTALDIEKAVWERLQTARVEKLPGESAQDACARAARAKVDEILSHHDLCLSDGIDKKTGQPRFTSVRQREAEREFYGKLLPEMLQPGAGHALDEKLVEEQIAAAEANNSKMFNKPFAFSARQKDAIRFLTESDAQLSTLVAWAGSGKTTLAQAAVMSWVAAGKKVVAMAPSNAAAENLRKEIGAAEHFTPERLAMVLGAGAKGAGKPSKKGPPKDPFKLDKDTVLYIDEASMLDFRETAPILEAARKAGAKVVLCGDPAQLPAVGMGNILRKICSDKSPEAEAAVFHITSSFEDADKIQRQRDFWQKQATAMLSMGHAAEAFSEYDRRGFVHRFSNGTEMIEETASRYADGLAESGERLRKALEEIRTRADRGIPPRMMARQYAEKAAALEQLRSQYKDRMMLSTTNEVVGRLNEEARERLKELGALQGPELEIDAGKDMPLKVCVGERLYFEDKANKTKAKSRKGEAVVGKARVGTVADIKVRNGNPILVIEIDGEREVDEKGVARPLRVEIDPRQFAEFSHAYALTVHKSQGASVENVWFCATPEDPSKGVFASRETALVAMTRHKGSLSVMALDTHVESLVKNSQRQMEKMEADDFFEQYWEAAPDHAKDEIREAAAEDKKAWAEIGAAAQARVEAQAHPAPKPEGRAAAVLRKLYLDPEKIDAKMRQLMRLPEMILARATRKERHGPASPEMESAERALGRMFGPRLESVLKAGIVDKRGSALTRGFKKRQWLCTDEKSRTIFSVNPAIGQVEARTYEDLGADLPAALALAARKGGDFKDMAPEPPKDLEPSLEWVDGILLGTGRKPHPKEPAGSRPSFYATVRRPGGQEEEVFLVGLEKALRDAQVGVGDPFKFARTGSEKVSVTLPDGTTKVAERSKVVAEKTGVEHVLPEGTQWNRGELLETGRKPFPGKEGSSKAAFFARMRMPDGSEQDVFAADLERALVEAGAKPGQEVEWVSLGKVKAKVPVPIVKDGVVAGWGEVERERQMVAARAVPARVGALSLPQKREAFGLATASLETQTASFALGLDSGKAARLFQDARSVLGLREEDSSIGGAPAWSHGIEEGGKRRLDLVVLAVDGERAYAASPHGKAALPGQAKGASSSRIFALELSELGFEARVGQGVVARIDAEGEAAFERVQSRAEKAAAPVADKLDALAAAAGGRGEYVRISGRVGGMVDGAALLLLEEGSAKTALRVPLEGAWKGAEAELADMARSSVEDALLFQKDPKGGWTLASSKAVGPAKRARGVPERPERAKEAAAAGARWIEATLDGVDSAGATFATRKGALRVSWEDLGAGAADRAKARRVFSDWLAETAERSAERKVNLGCESGRWSGAVVGGAALEFGPGLEASVRKGREALAREAGLGQPPRS